MPDVKVGRPRPLHEIIDGHLKMNFHPGQLRAWDSDKRIVAIISGTRSGKTSFGPPWLHREMQRKGPGDYLVGAPTFPRIDQAAGPDLEYFFDRLLGVGKMRRSPLQFHISEYGHKCIWPGKPVERRCRILFGHGDEPESMEAMGVKAVWLDEAGQKKFKFGSYEAVRRRGHIDQARTLITTTPYSLGWLKQEIQDEWENAHRNHPEIEVINFDSLQNPAFPREEYEQAMVSLPKWKFNMFYRGLFERPAGMIYDCFDRSRHKIPRFAIPPSWPRWLGLDFGGVHTAGVFLAEELDKDSQRTGRLFCYRVYGPTGNATAKQHVEALWKGEPCLPNAVGGSKSEGQWRDEFGAAGLGVREPPVSDVEVGIQRVYGCLARNPPELFVFDDLAHLLDELGSYSRALDEMGEPTQDIDDKSSFHCADALRYVVSHLKGGVGVWGESKPAPRDSRSLMADVPEGVFAS